MPRVKVSDVTVNYEQQGTGEPLIFIPYLAADHANATELHDFTSNLA